MTTEPPDQLPARDLLVAETSPDVIRAVVRDLLRAPGACPARLLAEVPTLSEHTVREALS